MLGASLALAIPQASRAQDRHPHYLRAMSDVSVAYRLIQRQGGDPPTRREEQRAIVAVEYAFSTLQNAATVVRKDPADQPPADDENTYDHRGRLHRALDLLRDARDQADLEEDDRDARPLQNRALRQIDAAIDATEAAIRADRY